MIKTITVAMTGASGAPYTLRLLEQLLLADCHVQFICSQPGQIVMAMETNLKLPSSPQQIQQQLNEHFNCTQDQLSVYGLDQWTAPVASGSSVADAMVVCPCSMGSLASIAHGISNNLIHRAADVIMKERKKLIIVPRETPFSSLHLENMLKLSNQDVIILPPNPAFYQGVESIQDLIDFVVSRILDQLNIENKLSPRWGQKDD
ncbi:MAG: UbiX family flavin prenyltransferase [Gammaproteobacteria bacterium]|jgi:4-hydroxy-3-polyprenylbenzoate decarboxylase|nr:UbiX family flavin prenyltransferase [Gammaproteobacteria bacterium]MBT3723570.1 UbiX family flavin prenyltransferase [Gammaproteobacteria bacterium]MBT4075989.1 UbiX family flavin prenyltransferase [Gammaproteobacteria bacterium]MBT4192854.1 UbiX family flavin prenyltransferase [Gammaproteobacteria bacterium]MBT4452285.1 UbiX family flavin prenyltransferase [Gammaproteobacteria bacterium]